MLFNWFRNRRRASLVGEPFPAAWDRVIHTNVVHDRHLTFEQRQRLRRLIQVFVAEKNWEGCGGLEMTDEIRVTVAALACLLVVGQAEDWYFDHVLSILVYPTGYAAAGTQITRAGVIMDDGQPRLGEAWWQGPVILSWSDSLAGAQMETPGHNLVLHEFAHQLDMMNGRMADGTPLLKTKQQFERWIAVLEPEFRRLAEDCERRHHAFMDCYGATSPAEFFAVITETFFERPAVLRDRHSEAYEVLQDFYKLDPASWPCNQR